MTPRGRLLLSSDNHLNQRRRVIHMKKRTYRGVEVNKVNRASLVEALAGEDLVVGIDMGKEVCFASLMGGEQGCRSQ
jgi:hypothetical protein